ncbi:Similar to Protein bfr-2; acc. no. Q7S6P8 [Pyronema omphalodes CBS 100304]|uniref:Protein BFR2 n=1 Tax=Pyronema omphalodes (strain CBS 100304) TaxID=1076935 RepID=U4KYP2_PYROM|nr:Similar to Protein bfr-2; acc. no. Q7S6P8 [Pyronema omphalodes CBS 100304]
MAPKKSLSLNEQLALLNDPAPVDFDPEALDREFSDGGSDQGSDTGSDAEEDDVDRAREHYLPVGKSALRAAQKKDLAPLGPKYEGSRVSRDNLYDSEDDDEDDDEEDGEDDDASVAFDDLQDGDIRIGAGSDGEDDDIDSDDALGSDDEKFASWKFKGSATTEGGKPPKKGDKVVGESDDEEEEDGEDMDDEDSGNEDQPGASDDEEDSEEDDEEDSDSEENEVLGTLTKMMAEEKKSISENINKAAQTDAEKGAAVRQQQKTFDSFLSARIKLQKSLIAVNSLPTTGLDTSLPEETQASWKAAEASAMKLWNTLYSLRVDISTSSTANPKKRKIELVDDNSSLDEIWAKMAKLESDATPWREGVLEKWSSKTQAVTTVSLGKKLNNATPRSLTASIRDTLATDHERLMNRTRVPRSCAPIQAADDNIENDAEVFDDTDLYQQLLKALVDQRMVDSSAGGTVRWMTAMRDAKKKKKVDTKASKGRKLRYHVHEKLQNFMAPEPNNQWQDSQITELFGSLLGQRIVVDEDDDEDMEDALPEGEEALQLFR